ncbi:hypothetical protein P7K49_009310, partial [Saguinus oedipus]
LLLDEDFRLPGNTFWAVMDGKTPSSLMSHFVEGSTGESTCSEEVAMPHVVNGKNEGA